MKEAKENEEIRLQHELTKERSAGEAMRQQNETVVGERTSLEERLVEYNRLKEESHANRVGSPLLDVPPCHCPPRPSSPAGRSLRAPPFRFSRGTCWLVSSPNTTRSIT